MKNLFAKFLSLSLKMKIITVAVPSVLVIGAVATPIIINANKEPLEAPIDVAEATVEPTIESTEEPTTAPVIEKTEDETVIEPEIDETVVKVTEEETVTVEEIETVEEVESEVVEEETIVEKSEPEVSEVTSNAEVPNTSNVNYTLPYIVNGIDIRSGDTDGDGDNDNNGNTWYDGQTWTASNGVTIRIADGYNVDASFPHWDSVFVDGTENIEPGSDFMNAFNEYIGYLELNNISTANLPQISTPASKQTTINKGDGSFIAYKAAFDPLWQTQNGSKLAQLQALDANHDGTFDGLGLLDALGSLGYIWTMQYDAGNGYWKLEVKGNYTELVWNSIHNSIRMITPDGDAVYNAIYEACYYDTQISNNPNTWYSYGGTSVMWDSSRNQADFLIK